MNSLVKKPSAWLPMAMSCAVLVMLFGFGIFGIMEPQEDEGVGAHMFQLLMGLQFPIIAWFAIRWLPQHPKEALQILLLQLVAGLAACAPVFFT